MKKMFFLRVGMFVWGACLLATGAVAQWESPPAPNAAPVLDVPALKDVQQARPPLSSPLTIALTYYKLAARAPDFESWVKQQDAYKNANTFDQLAVMQNMVQKFKDAYNGISLLDPLVVETQAQISPYDSKNQGFFVENFKSSTFFPASYAGQSYALVPQDIEDKKWLKVDNPDAAAAIEKAAAASNQQLTMVLSLVPRYADTSSPATIDGESYWPFAVDVRNMMLYQPGSDNLLWQSNDISNSTSDKTRAQILNLYH